MRECVHVCVVLMWMCVLCMHVLIVCVMYARGYSVCGVSVCLRV